MLDALAIGRAHVMAHDMGAISAMQLAYGHSERVRTMVQLAVPPAFMDFSPKLIPAFSHLPRLMRLQPPTLFVFGRQDSTFTEEVVRRISRRHERRTERVELAFVENASHFIPEDAPDAVAGLALEWFRSAG